MACDTCMLMLCVCLLFVSLSLWFCGIHEIVWHQLDKIDAVLRSVHGSDLFSPIRQSYFSAQRRLAYVNWASFAACQFLTQPLPIFLLKIPAMLGRFCWHYTSWIFTGIFQDQEFYSWLFSYRTSWYHVKNEKRPCIQVKLHFWANLRIWNLWYLSVALSHYTPCFGSVKPSPALCFFGRTHHVRMPPSLCTLLASVMYGCCL